MRSTILSILFTAMLVPASVSAQNDPLPRALGIQGEAEEKADSFDDILKSSYTGKRWIGIARNRSTCPKVTGWQAQKLTDKAKSRARGEEGVSAAASSHRPGREIEIPNLPDTLIKVWPSTDALLKNLGLDRICIYTREPGSTVEFVPPSSLKAPRQDRLALATTSAGGLPSDTLSALIWEKLAAQGTEQTGQVVFEPGSPNIRKTFRFNRPPGVRLTFLDTQPDSQTSGGGAFAPPALNESMHGFTLAHLAQEIVCPAGSGASRTCAATIESRRALSGPEDSDTSSHPAGLVAHRNGHVGLVSELATAIVAEVLDWQEREPHKHLVLNLSLGWDGEGFGDLDAHSVRKLEPSVRAVYEAIRFARKSGALVIAAAGNRRGGSKTEWPLLPAAWELRRPCWFPLPLGRKPVYAVGGVDWQNLPLANSRTGGRPRRVAYADHSVTYSSVLHGPTAMYTGTSVSAAVTSSIAAVIWHLRPDLGPSKVMKLIERSGDPMDFRADFYGWKDIWPLSKLKAAPEARKLSLCKAVVEACGSQGSACGGRVEPFASCLKVDPAWTPGIGPLDDFPISLKYAIARTPDPQETPDIGSQRWVYPQPEATPCPGCSVLAKDPPLDSVAYELVFSIGDEWRRESHDGTKLIIESGSLEIKCQGSDPIKREVPPSAFQASPSSPRLPGPVRINLEDVPNLTSCEAGINFEVREAGKKVPVYNPVLIDPAPKS